MNERISAMDASNPGRASDPGVATPAGSGGFVAGLFSGQKIPALAAKIGASIGSFLGRPIRIGNKVIAARHADVLDLLSRDLDFRIGPVNETKINAVNGGPFVLGMDRGCRLARERQALYRALAEVDLAPIREAARAEAEERLDTASTAIDVVNEYARPIAAHMAERLFGIGPGLDFTLFMDVVRAVFAHTFLNQSDDKDVAARALRAAALMRQWFEAEIAKRRTSCDFGADMMGALMRNTWLDDDAVRRTLGGMLVGSIDTTATSVAKIVATLAGDKALAAHVASDLDNPDRFAGWCREAMRYWPHNPIVIRQAVADTVFNTVEVKKGDQVIAWTQAAMLDPTVFPSPGLLRPDRPSAHYLHFGGGLHPCAGRVINGFQIPLLVGALVRRGIVSAGSIAWAGPFPDRLSVRLKGTSP
jgi:cytochrome P450